MYHIAQDDGKLPQRLFKMYIYFFFHLCYNKAMKDRISKKLPHPSPP